MEVPWGLLLAATNSVGVLGVVIWFLRDRRRDQVATRVAERTENAQVDLTSISAAEAHFALVNKAYDAERASYAAERASLLRQIADRDAQLAEERTQKQQLQQKVLVLQEHVDEMNGRMRALQETLNEVTRELAEHQAEENRADPPEQPRRKR